MLNTTTHAARGRWRGHAGDAHAITSSSEPKSIYTNSSTERVRVQCLVKPSLIVCIQPDITLLLELGIEVRSANLRQRERVTTQPTNLAAPRIPTQAAAPSHATVVAAVQPVTATDSSKPILSCSFVWLLRATWLRATGRVPARPRASGQCNAPAQTTRGGNVLRSLPERRVHPVPFVCMTSFRTRPQQREVGGWL